MASVPIIASERPSKLSDEPPPPCRRSASGAVLILVGLLPGLVLGMAVSRSPPVQLCQDAADPIACLIYTLD